VKTPCNAGTVVTTALLLVCVDSPVGAVSDTIGDRPLLNVDPVVHPDIDHATTAAAQKRSHPLGFILQLLVTKAIDLPYLPVDDAA
jgi:hypothetical protein